MIVVVKIVFALILAFIVIDFALVVVYHKKKKVKNIDSDADKKQDTARFSLETNSQALNGGKRSRVARNSQND